MARPCNQQLWMWLLLPCPLASSQKISSGKWSRLLEVHGRLNDEPLSWIPWNHQVPTTVGPSDRIKAGLDFDHTYQPPSKKGRALLTSTLTYAGELFMLHCESWGLTFFLAYLIVNVNFTRRQKRMLRLSSYLNTRCIHFTEGQIPSFQEVVPSCVFFSFTSQVSLWSIWLSTTELLRSATHIPRLLFFFPEHQGGVSLSFAIILW